MPLISKVNTPCRKKEKPFFKEENTPRCLPLPGYTLRCLPKTEALLHRDGPCVVVYQEMLPEEVSFVVGACDEELHSICSQPISIMVFQESKRGRRGSREKGQGKRRLCLGCRVGRSAGQILWKWPASSVRSPVTFANCGAFRKKRDKIERRARNARSDENGDRD
ncbi:hypothetical protein ElyMa_003287800 [Elysia marginata]|uniref:Uncharacterized protein n=1 Tax=Elysia marginata TaxID=1093978 RepID=A0AAV4JBH8_9GAST|nr:hypothetical protein ElyMa_003287800 [Elysia marginata]